MHFQPSNYSAPPYELIENPKKVKQERSTGQEVGAAAGKELGKAAASGIGKALPAVGGLASVPVAGWIAAGAVAAGVGTFALVRAIRKGKAKKEEVIKIAEANNIPDAKELPGFTVKVIKMSDAKREKLAAKYQKKLDKLQDKGPTRGLFKKSRQKGRDKKIKKLKSRLAILAVADTLERAANMGQEPAANVTGELEQLAKNLNDENLDSDKDEGFFTPKVILVGGLVLLGGTVATFLLLRGKK